MPQQTNSAAVFYLLNKYNVDIHKTKGFIVLKYVKQGEKGKSEKIWPKKTKEILVFFGMRCYNLYCILMT